MTAPQPRRPPTQGPDHPVPRGTRRVSDARIAALVLAALAVLAMVPVAGAAAWYLDGKHALASSTAAADAFLGYLEAGDDTAAYRQLCGELVIRFSEKQFTEAVERLPRPRTHGLVTVFFASEATNDVYAEADVTDAGGATRRLTLALTRQRAGTWTVCGKPFDDPPPRTPVPAQTYPA